MKIEMERHQLINLIMACSAADKLSSPDTMKWMKMHDQLMYALREYDSDIEAAVNAKVSSRRVYKLEKEVEV